MHSWGVACILLTFGCGGVSHGDGLQDHSDADGGAAESDAGNGGVTGVLPASDGGAAGASGTLCVAPPLGCEPSATYVDVSDAKTTKRLAYDATSGSSSEACPILATGVSRCGFFNLRLSACSAPNGGGTCLDTASNEPHYIDSSGKRWTMLDLAGSSAQLNGVEAEGLVDLDLTLAVGSDATYQELAVHAHVCASISAVLIPCR